MHGSHWVYTPNCAEVRTRRKVVRVEEQEQVCKPKWVVEYLCDHCSTACQAATEPASQPAGFLSSLFGGKAE